MAQVLLKENTEMLEKRTFWMEKLKLENLH
jgi:hypothetical protein